MSPKLIQHRIDTLVSMLQSDTWTDQQLAAYLDIKRSHLCYVVSGARKQGYNVRRVTTGTKGEGVYEILPEQYKPKPREKLYCPNIAVDVNNQ